MRTEGILVKDKNVCYLEVDDGDRYSIHSIVDLPKVSKLQQGCAILGTLRKYSKIQLDKLGWEDKVGVVEPGHLWVKEKCT